MQQIRFIAAIDDRRGLAKHQRTPWHIPADQRFFREQVTSAPALVGWNTFKAMGQKLLPQSPKTYVLAHRLIEDEKIEVVHDLQKFMDGLQEDLWVLGGGEVYAQLINQATELVLTRVGGDYDCDVLFPEFEHLFRLAWQSGWQEENGYEFQFQRWVSK